MKHQISLAILILPVILSAQKIKPYNYDFIDTFFVYKNAHIIVYKIDNLTSRDTIFYPLKQDLIVKESGVVIYDDEKMIKRKRLKK